MATSAALLVFSASAARVEIDAKGGVIPNDSSAEVAITTAAGSGSAVTAAESETTIATLSQEQSTADATVKLESDGTLTLGGIVVAPSAKALIIGTGAHVGVLQATTNAVCAEVAENASLTINADFPLGSKALAKLGLGTITLTGDFYGNVVQGAGEFVYRDSANAYGVRIAASENASYQFASSGEFGGELSNLALGSGELKSEAVVYGGTTSQEVPISEFEVNGGSVVRSAGAKLVQYRLYKSSSEYTSSAPACGAVGTNSVGILKLDGGSYYGKLAVGIGNEANAKGIVRIYNGAIVDNFSSMESTEWLFGSKGYAFMDVDGGYYRAHGKWGYGSDGQALIYVKNGSFSLGSASESAWYGSTTFGGSDGKAVLYVGKGGAVKMAGDATRDISVGGNSAQVQMTVDDGATFDVGANEITYSGEDTVFNVRNGGAVTCGGYVWAGGDGVLQFDGGTWNFTATTERSFGRSAYIHEGGATLSVAADCEVTMKYPLANPDGKGVEAIDYSPIAEVEFLGPPVIEINGANGDGATAICVYDAETRRVTGIKITGRGFGYTSANAKAWYGTKSWNLGEVTLTDNESGAVIKTGEGTLVFEQANSYTGMTQVEGGTLKIEADKALSSSAGLALRGGSLDLSEVGSVVVNDYKGDGNGSVLDGGTLIVGSLTCDLENGNGERVPEVLNLKNVQFAPGATLKLVNTENLDAAATYILYTLNDYSGSGFPRLDATVYDTLSRRWGISVENNQVVLKCYDGSLFIYY